MRSTEFSRTRSGARASTRTVATLAVAIAAVTFGGVSGEVRGVAPADQPRFAADGVKCFVGGVERVVPLARINDDYCDCDDGKDEPGTAACSHLLGSVFYCDNGGFFPKHIHTSTLNDGICDCCDGTDEFDAAGGAGQCKNSCIEDAVVYKQKAEARLADVEAGFRKREDELKTVVEAHFADAKEKDALTDKALASLALLKERVQVHKAREERREKMMRLEAARQKLPADHAAQQGDAAVENPGAECVANTEAGTTCENVAASGEPADPFREVDASDLADAAESEADTLEDGAEKDAVAADESDSRRVTTMMELSDGTKVSLADYLRMSTARSTQRKTPPRTADQMRREDFLGPLFNGDEAARKRIGLYALRTVGILTSPARAVAEAVMFVPRMLWDIASSSTIVSPYLESLPSPQSITQSAAFRRLGEGRVHEAYKAIAWGSRVVWDAPVVAYQYLFPELDPNLTLPEAESLRKVLKEIEDDAEKLRKEREARQADLAFDYGPNRAFYSLKDQCIEKQVEKYVYKLCPFQEVKQDYTNMGKWEGWGKVAADDGTESTDYSVMKFANGLRCWNGPERSVHVTLECGATNEIVSVDEPSTCVYQMHARSHAACSAEVLAQAKAELAFWSKRDA